jgi:ATP-dependent DNA ligase
MSLSSLIGGPGFTGRAPLDKSRWSTKERKAIPLRPAMVVEVSADQITGNHMRHGSRLLRWRDDKAPADCMMDQFR